MNCEYNFCRFGLVLFIGFIAVGYSFAYQNFESDEILRLRYNIQNLTSSVNHGEGPHWDAEKQLLYFVDIYGGRINRYNPCSKQLTYAQLNDNVSVAIPISGTSDKFIVGKGKTLGIVTWNGENIINPPFEKIDPFESNKTGHRFNDGKSDRAGRLWIGTMGYEDPDPKIGVKLYQGTLYRFSSDTCQLEPIIYNVSISNGIAWSSDNRLMYYIDTNTKSVEKFSYDIRTGNIGNRSILMNFTEKNIAGSPDGMTIDDKGNLWIACWNGSQVINVNSTSGEVINAIKLPVSRPTSVAFGGKNLDTLYVTSMAMGLTEEEKNRTAAGALFSISNLGVTGVRSSPVQIPKNCSGTRR